MNPETKLTTDELLKICERHGIVYVSHERITTGFNHEVHRLNDDLVIKLFNKSTNKNFLCESRILAADSKSIRKPDLVVAHETVDEQERAYIIMSYVPGASPAQMWHRVNDAQRERLVSQISDTLRGFQDLDVGMFDFYKSNGWQERLNDKMSGLLARLKDKNALQQTVLDDVKAIIPKLSGVFADNEVLKPVYWDIHFDNFIVDEDCNLQAVIDLENVRQLPLDYPLFVVKKQMEEPQKYLREEDEHFADTKHYEKLWQWYKKYYPEMFAYKDLEKRVTVYQLLDTLHLLINWSHVADLHVKLDSLISAVEGWT